MNCIAYPSLLALFGAAMLTVGASAQQLLQTEQTPPPPDVAAPPADATKLPSGLAFKILQPGQGTTRPRAIDLVIVHYTAWTTDGRMFDSSHQRKAPSTLPLERVIKGFGEGLQQMVVGEKRRLWIPQDLAYGGQSGRPRGRVVYDVELLEIIPSPTIAPPDVKAAPADASRTSSGLAYNVLKAGTGTRRPTRQSQVTVHYTGWTTDGKMFDSSVARGAPTTFVLDEVIAGWTEGVQLMVEGEKTRFWIPANLAYEGRQGPQGTLVFDIELIAIRN